MSEITDAPPAMPDVADVNDTALPTAPGPAATPALELRPGVEQAATFAAMMAKGRRRDEFKVPLPDGGALVVKAEAVGHTAYDALIAECPPTERERAAGIPFEMKKFGPRLLAACLTQPTLTVDEARSLWTNEDWAEGEVIGLFNKVNNLCQRGLDVPFTAPG